MGDIGFRVGVNATIVLPGGLGVEILISTRNSPKVDSFEVGRVDSYCLVDGRDHGGIAAATTTVKVLANGPGLLRGLSLRRMVEFGKQRNKSGRCSSVDGIDGGKGEEVR